MESPTTGHVVSRPSSGAARLLLVLALAALTTSCAYYNTFYLARKYYFRGTSGAPYSTEGGVPANVSQLNKSIDYSKKVLAQYAKSKLVDDAYLLWARALLGKGDPLQTVNMLQDFDTRFPKSPLQAEAMFYLGVAQRQARHYADAVTALDYFLHRAPRHALVPYAHLELSRALMALERPADAAQAASQVLEHYPKSELADPARAARAEARLANGDYDEARADFKIMGLRATTDDDRLGFLLREADCLESGRRFDDELALLREAISHEREPALVDTTGGRAPAAPTGPGADRWGRIMVRIGGAQLLAGHLNEAMTAYRRIVSGYPKSALGAEAQYRIGYALETTAEDFEKARGEYARVKDQTSSGPFLAQANERLGNLDRLAQFRSAGGDSLQKQAEAGFMLAELYLFTHKKPDKALDQYRKIADSYKGTPWAAKALNAQGWVLSRKFDRKAEADSLFWAVVHDYPATEEQLAARDYLESAGEIVPDSLIKMPPPKVVPVDTSSLAHPPAAPGPIGVPPRGLFAPTADSLRIGPGHPGALQFAPGSPGGSPVPFPLAPAGPAGSAARDSTTQAARPDTTRTPAATDSTRRVVPPAPAPRDTTKNPTVADTTRRTAPTAPAPDDSAGAKR
jgi:TolA-binding protein